MSQNVWEAVYPPVVGLKAGPEHCIGIVISLTP